MATRNNKKEHMGPMIKNLLKWKVLLGFSLSLFMLLYFLFFYSPNYKHNLYSYYANGFSGKWVGFTGILSKSKYEELFLEKVIKESPKIIKVSNNKIGGLNTVIFIDHKGRDYILNGLSNVDPLFQPYDNKDFALLVTKFLNIQAFNKYVSELGVNSKKQIINEFCNLYILCFGNENFVLIDSPEIFINLYNEKYDETSVDDNILLNREFLIEKSFSNQIPPKSVNMVFAWINILGIVQIEFSFDEYNQVKNINPTFIGQFGCELYY
jgi:hypothetical protein